MFIYFSKICKSHASFMFADLLASFITHLDGVTAYRKPQSRGFETFQKPILKVLNNSRHFLSHISFLVIFKVFDKLACFPKNLHPFLPRKKLKLLQIFEKWKKIQPDNSPICKNYVIIKNDFHFESLNYFPWKAL